VRPPSWRGILSTPSTRPQIYRRLHTECRPLTTTSSLHRPSPRSRALGQLPQLWNHAASAGAWKRWFRSPTDHIRPLESGFPTKTVIGLLVVGGIAYWAYSKVVNVGGFEHDVLYNAHTSWEAAMPLQHMRTRENLVLVQSGTADILAPRPSPNAMGGRGDETLGDAHGVPADEELSVQAGGWMMNEEESRRCGIPLTHGCRALSNFPCVSRCLEGWTMMYIRFSTMIYLG